MPFSYYRRLSRSDQRTYRRSDRLTELPLPAAPRLHGCVQALQAALERDDNAAVERIANRLCAGITRSLAIPGVCVAVRAVRPHNAEGELQGLYTLDTRGRAQIEVWMRTARERRVVAFRTFLRTLLHELCHHLDLTLFGLPETFHTQGFFRRESSLFRQLVPLAQRGARATQASEAAALPKARRPRSKQLMLFE